MLNTNQIWSCSLFSADQKTATRQAHRRLSSCTEICIYFGSGALVREVDMWVIQHLKFFGGVASKWKRGQIVRQQVVCYSDLCLQRFTRTSHMKRFFNQLWNRLYFKQLNYVKCDAFTFIFIGLGPNRSEVSSCFIFGFCA